MESPPISKIVPIPLSVTARQSDAEVKAALERLRDATDCSITSACELAREARTSSTSAQKMRVVNPNKPLPSGDVTERFEAIRANVK